MMHVTVHAVETYTPQSSRCAPLLTPHHSSCCSALLNHFVDFAHPRVGVSVLGAELVGALGHSDLKVDAVDLCVVQRERREHREGEKVASDLSVCESNTRHSKRSRVAALTTVALGGALLVHSTSPFTVMLPTSMYMRLGSSVSTSWRHRVRPRGFRFPI